MHPGALGAGRAVDDVPEADVYYLVLDLEATGPGEDDVDLLAVGVAVAAPNPDGGAR